jgi:plasmid stabilization system protein ParE
VKLDIQWTEPADERLATIWNARLFERIVSAVESLRDFPELGRVVPGDRGLRSLLVGPFQLIYRRVRIDVLEIVTLCDANKEWPFDD